ncbi:hypothetical protein Ancab_002464, partial [Ancistrocladus abbreviatus]
PVAVRVEVAVHSSVLTTSSGDVINFGDRAEPCLHCKLPAVFAHRAQTFFYPSDKSRKPKAAVKVENSCARGRWPLGLRRILCTADRSVQLLYIRAYRLPS